MLPGVRCLVPWGTGRQRRMQTARCVGLMVGRRRRGLLCMSFRCVRGQESKSAAFAAAPWRVAAAADEGGRCVGLTAGADAACVGACGGRRTKQTKVALAVAPWRVAAAANDGGRCAGLQRAWLLLASVRAGGGKSTKAVLAAAPWRVAAAADEGGRCAGLTAGVAAACGGGWGRQSGGGTRAKCGTRCGTLEGCCGGRRRRAVRWPHGWRGCCLRSVLVVRPRSGVAGAVQDVWHECESCVASF